MVDNMSSKKPYRVLKICYNSNMNGDERMEVFKKYAKHPRALSSKFDYKENASMVKFDCSSIVSQLILESSHKNVRLEVNVSKYFSCDPRVLFLSVERFELNDITVISEVEDLGGKVIFERSSYDNHIVFLVEFKNFYHSSQALAQLEKNNYNHHVKFAKIMNCDKWKIQEINDFGNCFYQPEGKVEHNSTRPKLPSFFIRVDRDPRVEIVIDTVFKNLEGFIECKKFPFKCDSTYIYYKLTYNSEDKATNALQLFHSLPYGKVSKICEDYVRSATVPVHKEKDGLIKVKRAAANDSSEDTESKKPKMSNASVEYKITELFGY